jgi:2-oxoglutarate ferredoxin oxidoreductase subunit alpha
MVIGAGWAGARAMTSTSGPGISLMGEFAGLAYYAELPGVVFDIQRVGPSTGLPTRTAQGDILQVATLSHGDTKQMMLIPASAEECYTMAMAAFDLAERFQTLVFVMSDLDLGMNTWMSPTFAYPETPLDRGKLLDEPTLKRLANGDAIVTSTATGFRARTIPGTGGPAYFARIRAQRKAVRERRTTTSTTWIGLRGEFDTARDFVPKPILTAISIPTSRLWATAAAIGPSRRAGISSHERWARQPPTCRLRAYPFTERKPRRSSIITSASTSSSRTATGRC